MIRFHKTASQNFFEIQRLAGRSGNESHFTVFILQRRYSRLLTPHLTIASSPFTTCKIGR